MSTYLDMQNRIADELARADLTTQIQKAILSAIEFYKDDRFWFNEGEVVINTTIGQDHDTLTTTLGEIDEATVTVPGSDRYIMTEWSYDDIRENAVLNSLIGRPEHYTVFEESIWYYPIPDAVYPITLSGLIYFATLNAPTDTNAWTNEAERLIRFTAKADLFGNVIRNDKEYAKMDARAQVEWSKLMQKTVQKISSGRLKPIRF